MSDNARHRTYFKVGIPTIKGLTNNEMQEYVRDAIESRADAYGAGHPIGQSDMINNVIVKHMKDIT